MSEDAKKRLLLNLEKNGYKLGVPFTQYMSYARIDQNIGDNNNNNLIINDK